MTEKIFALICGVFGIIVAILLSPMDRFFFGERTFLGKSACVLGTTLVDSRSGTRVAFASRIYRWHSICIGFVSFFIWYLGFFLRKPE